MIPKAYIDEWRQHAPWRERIKKRTNIGLFIDVHYIYMFTLRER